MSGIRKRWYSYIETEPRLLRPINYPRWHPRERLYRAGDRQGQSWGDQRPGKDIYAAKSGESLSPCRRGSPHGLRAETHVIFVDMHAETTSEKIAIGRFLDGKVSAVAGTHTHIQTADEQIFPGGTAFICDAGMCGPTESVLGREIQPIIQRFVSSMPVNFPVAKGEVKLHGILVDIDHFHGQGKINSQSCRAVRGGAGCSGSRPGGSACGGGGEVTVACIAHKSVRDSRAMQAVGACEESC